METINNGSYNNDPSAESIRASFEKCKNNFSEIMSDRIYYMGDEIFNNAIAVSDEDDVYAHGAFMNIKEGNNKALAYIVYGSHKTDNNENATGDVRMIIYNLHTRVIISSTLVCAEAIGGQIYELLTGLFRIVYTRGQAVYYKDYDPSTNELSVEGAFQITIRNATNDGWEETSRDLTYDTLNVHFNNTNGGGLPTNGNGGAANTIPLVRGIHRAITREIDSVNHYFSSCEAYFLNYGDYGVSCLIESADMENWKIYPPIALDSSTYLNNKQAETIYVYINNMWNAISRWYGYLYASSSDGITWSAQIASGLASVSATSGALLSACYLGLINGGVASDYALVAYNRTPTLSGRSCLAIAITEDMINFEDIAIMHSLKTAHYPCLDLYDGTLYMAFSQRLREITGDRNTIMFSRLNMAKLLVEKLYT